MKLALARVWAYFWGNQETAEDLDVAAVADVVWISEAATNPILATYALEASKRSADLANSAVASIQEKASGLLSVALTLLPLAGAAAGLALTRPDSLISACAFLSFVVVTLLLLGSALRAFLAVGSVIVGGLNVSRLHPGVRESLGHVIAEEAQAWHSSAMIAMELAKRRSADLFSARRAIILALVVATVGAMLLSTASSGVRTVPDPIPPHETTPAPSPGITSPTWVSWTAKGSLVGMHGRS